ncbi:MAG: DUF4388 domain-containing protein [Actinobacteria bacterium]|nr:DUF4388 domain-containing protein [Actinomycetota bacterium]
MALNGSLDDYSPAGALRVLSSTGRTGAVRFTGDAGCTVYLHRGQLYFARDEHTDDALVSALVRPGRITTEAWTDAVEEAGQLPQIGELLVARDAIDPDLLASVTLSVVYDPLIRLFREGDGTFDFEPDVVHWIGPFRTFNVDAVLNEVRRRVRDVDEMATLVPSLDCVVRAVPSLPGKAGQVTLLREDWELVVGIEGGSPITTLADRLGRGRYSTARVVHRLAQAGLVDVEPMDVASIRAAADGTVTQRDATANLAADAAPGSHPDDDGSVLATTEVPGTDAVDDAAVDVAPVGTPAGQPEFDPWTALRDELAAEAAEAAHEADDTWAALRDLDATGGGTLAEDDAWASLDLQPTEGAHDGLQVIDEPTIVPDDPDAVVDIAAHGDQPGGDETGDADVLASLRWDDDASPEGGDGEPAGDPWAALNDGAGSASPTGGDPWLTGWGESSVMADGSNGGDGGEVAFSLPRRHGDHGDGWSNGDDGGLGSLSSISGFRSAVSSSGSSTSLLPSADDDDKAANAAWLESLYDQFMRDDEVDLGKKSKKKEALEVAFHAPEVDADQKVGTLRKLFNALKGV